MLGHKRIPSREGGAEVVVEELATRMTALGHQVTCFNRKKKNSKKEAGSFKGIRLRYVWTIDWKGFAALSASVTASVLTLFGRYDVIHYHAEGPCIMLWLPKLFGKRCIATIHGLDHQRAKWGKMARRCILLGEWVAVKFADEIIVLSRNVQNYFLETYGRKTIFIPNGVSSIPIRPLDLIQKKYQLKKDGYILYLGRLVPEKGIQYLIRAYQKLDTDKKLVIAGESSDTDEFVCELKRLAEGNPNIIFTGFVEGALLDELYSNAYLYVLPSDLEGMPLSLLEAMSAGNCCVVSDIEECTAVTEDHAVVFKRGDTEDLREKLQILCKRPELVRRYKETAADFICRKYHWNDIVERTLDVYSGRIRS
ncbi:MAG: glycosyltransferase family 4 protein [Lachnospiraceae bacterium]|nr:glycosyltransferase family 4 protein [Lachnospiraceae bacterium]